MGWIPEPVSTEVTDHGVMGAAETFDASVHDHKGTQDANLTVTLTGATNGEAAWMTLVLTQDGTGGHSITLPASVANGSDIEADWDTTAGNVNVLTVFSYDGGTIWYAALMGGSGGSDLTIEDEGSALATTATILDFVGDGVTASGTGAEKTITIPGGSGASADDTHAWQPLLDDDGAIVTDGDGDPTMGFAPL